MVVEITPGKLNIFQRAMLQWNDLHPYNAVHVARLRGVPQADQLRRVITTALTNLGLSTVTLNRRRGTYQHDRKTGALEFKVLTQMDIAGVELAAQVEHEINRPFDIDGRFCPFRFFVVPGPDSFNLGVCYFHPIADAESMIMLMRRILGDYAGAGDSSAQPGLDCHPAPHDRWLLVRPGLVLRKLLALPSDIRRMRRSFRARLLDADDLTNRFRFMVAATDVLRLLKTSAKAWEVTFNDLLLAVLMKSLSTLEPSRTSKPRRQNISLGAIVNVRGDCAIDCERTFGLFLGSFVVSHPVPIGIPLRALAADIRRQTSRIKRHRLYLADPLELAIAGRFFSYYSKPRQKRFYHKFHPLWGGVSNMSLESHWQMNDTSRPIEYFRAVSTGPITPLVVSTTTYGDRLAFAISYRPAVFTSTSMDQLQTQLSAELEMLEGRG